MPMRHHFSCRDFIKLAVAVLAAATASPARGESLFSGFDVSGGLAWGGSDTTDGGAAVAGGGTVHDVAFGSGIGLGGHLGYRLTSDFAVTLSYHYLQADVFWRADYALAGVGDSNFAGRAASHVLMGSGIFTHALSDATALELRGGLGVALNSLSNVEEIHAPDGQFLAVISEERQVSPAAEIAVGLSHAISPTMFLALETSATYVGDFSTGDTRTGNLGVTDIGRYSINDVWHGKVGAALRVDF